MKLDDIGFLEVIEERARDISTGKISYCEWLITSDCNFNCPYCNRLEPRYIPDLDLIQVRKYIKILSDMKCKYIHLTGGEPTTREDLIDIITLIKEANIRVGISTNGSKSLEYYKELISAGIELFSISLDVHRKELNPRFTLVSEVVFDTVVNNIKELSKLVYTNVGIVFNDHNINNYKEIIEFVSSLGTHDIRIMTSTRYNKTLKFELDPELLNKHPILKFRVDNFNAGLNIRGSWLSTTSRCHLVRDDITLFGDNFYPCAVYVREKGSPIGTFDNNNIAAREQWFREHNSHTDEICLQYCMDFKCRFNDIVETFEASSGICNTIWPKP